jgi:hypothetical protein
MVWRSIGPTTQVATEDFVRTYPDLVFRGTVSGRTEALAYSEDIHPTNMIPALFNGAGSGGIWRTTDIAGAGINQQGWIRWILVSPLPGTVRNQDGALIGVQSQRGINRIGALAQGNRPWNVNVVYAGTGDPERRGGAGVLRSQSGGDAGSWRLISQQQDLVGKSIARIIFNPRDHTGRSLFAAVVPPQTYTGQEKVSGPDSALGGGIASFETL